MLLSASTALCKDWVSYVRVRNYMITASIVLTGLHILVAFTPLYDLIVRGILGAPEDIIEPGRLGLQIMLPWTASIAYRRFHQGVLIRFGHTPTVGAGTVIRLASNLIVLTTGYLSGELPGIAVGTMAVIAGVVSEAIYVSVVVQPVLRQQVRPAPALAEVLTWRRFMSFYVPLVITSLLGLIIQPIGSAAISRMPLAVESLAAWSVVSGLTFLLRSLGLAFNEVVVAALDQTGAYPNLRRFAGLLAFGTSLTLLVITATPLSGLWFERLSGLNPTLSALATTSLWFAVITPALATLQSLYQGVLLNTRKTGAITESVTAFLVVCISTLALGIAWARTPGLYVGALAFTLAMLAQTGWLYLRSRNSRQEFTSRAVSTVIASD
jgi:hypothetical protein